MSRYFIASIAPFALAISSLFPAGDLVAQEQTQQQQQARDSITGTITVLNENEVTVRTDDQQTMTVLVDRETRILDAMGQQETRESQMLGNLDTGDRVVVHYRLVREGEHVAVSIAQWTDDRQEARGAAADQDQRTQQEMQRRDELPRTSSTLPLLAALGLLGLVGAGALSVAARREH